MEISDFHDKQSVSQLELEEAIDLDNRVRNFLTCKGGESISNCQTPPNSK